MLLTHAQLIDRAKKWLSGTRGCSPVFSNLASCQEIPDAIGWSSSHKWYGSTVIECKTSANDFYADKRKHVDYRHLQSQQRVTGRRFTQKDAKERGFEPIASLLMGDYRFYMCDEGILSASLVAAHTPEHGLLWLHGKVVQMLRPAERRKLVDKDAEIRYLRFAILNGKTPHMNMPAEGCP